MKKLVYLSLVCITAICLILLTGCNETHTHNFGEWTVTKEASCLEDGSRTRACQCGESETKTIPAAGHTEEIVAGTPATCTESGLTEGKKCSVCGETTLNQEEIPPLNHSYKYTEIIDENGDIATMVVCQREGCDHISTSTAGLYDADDNLVASWAELVNVYGLEAQNGSFPNLSRVIYENETLQKGSHLIIDDSITEVNFEFLLGCPNITRVFIPSSVIKIMNTILDNCINLTEISVDEDNEYYKSIDGNLYSKDGKTFIRYSSAKNDVEFAIPYGVETIESGAIVYCSSLKKLYIPNSVTVIKKYGLYGGVPFNVYFAGTTEEWEAIEEKMPVDWWISNNIIIHYEGKIKFVANILLHMYGTGGYRLSVVIDGNKFYDHNILYSKISCIENLEIANEDRILSKFEGLNEEKTTIIAKILANKNWYICENEHEAIAICNIDGVYYFLLLYKEETTDMYSVETIHYANLNWEDEI